MTNSVAPNYQCESYSDLIREAFVAPIRTVTVIDDEYPTLNHLLNKELNSSVSTSYPDNLFNITSYKCVGVLKIKPEPQKSQLKPENIERLNSIIEMCQTKHKWSVNVYDGKTPKFGSGTNDYDEHINHSDLLILDYHLDGDSSHHGGIRARKIIKGLATNNHFNIIVVHTKGNDDDIDGVFNEILKELFVIKNHEFSIEEDTDNKIESWLEVNDPDETKYPFLKNKLDIKNLIKVLTCKKLKTNIRDPKHPYHYARDDILNISNNSDVEQNEIVSWLILNELKNHQELLTGDLNQQLDWEYEGDVNYIATGRVFITVIKKVKDEPVDIIHDKLCKALVKQNAAPMYLLMAKMRHELDDKGLEQAAIIINNRYAQAGWLYNLLEKSGNDPTQHERAIDLHWEQLSSSSKTQLVKFSERLVISLQSNGLSNRDLVKSFFQECINDQNVALGHLNAYSCSRPISNYHLTTGTILKIGVDELWVCLSPACDLVPEQRVRDWQDRIGLKHLTFKAIKLFKGDSTLAKANSKANDNEYIFLNIDGELKHYQFANGNPQWETFYAKDMGMFDSEKAIEVNCLRIVAVDHNDTGEAAVVEAAGELKLVTLKMHAITELRYEYALNLLHKFGANQTRVGLGFTDRLWD